MLSDSERASLLRRSDQSVPRISFQVLEPDNLFCPLYIEPVPLDLVNEYKIEFDAEKRCIKQGVFACDILLWLFGGTSVHI